jgi:lipopolysaccharide biosynthesis protein
LNTVRVLCASRSHQLVTISESELFDCEWYADQYPDVNDLGVEPRFHYVWIGADLGRDPSPEFETRFYLDQNPDVAQSGLNPLYHYISSGRQQGRAPKETFALRRSPGTTDRRAEFRVDRTISIGADQDWLIFVAYCPKGRLSDCQKYQISAFKAAGYQIALVISSDNFGNMADPGLTGCEIQIVRENIGFDFGAWRHAIELLGGLSSARSVTFTNDSILPTAGGAGVARLRERIGAATDSIVFMTRNFEVKPHLQSYLFRLDSKAIALGAFSELAAVPYYTDKEALIHNVEVHLEDRLTAAGHTVCALFPTDAEDNPTIHHWEELLDRGFPFLKIQLVTADVLAIDEPRLKARLEPDVHHWLAEHCESRRSPGSQTRLIRNLPSVPAIKGAGRFTDDGAQQAFNPPAQQNPTLRVPVDGIALQPPGIPRILAIVHAFYVDIASEILVDLAALEIPIRIVLTTDCEEKVRVIEAELGRLELSGEVVLCPNRGRDVAPFIIEGSRFADDADILLHLHTKKSPHDSIYADWGSYLRRNLVGSRESVLSILKVFEETGIGLVFSDHFGEVVGLRNWGFDYEDARALLQRLSILIDSDTTLEFPTSTMFWARREALDPLFKAGLRYEDFEEENGQVDGTLAHAVERCLVYVTQSAGFSYTKVTAADEASEPESPLLRLAAGGLSYALDRPVRFLPGDSTVRSDFHRAVPEVYPVSVARSRSAKRRLTALLPTMKPNKIYGGITTALKVLGEIRDALPGDIDLRVLITSDNVDPASVAELSKRLNRNFAWIMPDDDAEGDTIVGVAENQHIPLCLRANEYYVATAWWTADLGFRLVDRQREMHGRTSRLAYIIQDFEPGFYNWSNTYALAEATYLRGEQTAAIINSEELSDYMAMRYSFAHACCVAYELNPMLDQLIQPARPDRMILAYGRPSVSRNCFELLCEGIRLWQARRPTESRNVEIIFAGEDFQQDRIAGLLNARCAGKMSIEDYAAMLNRSAVGISLMVSPHPSYPPLEMAAAGCITISNRYEGKDLTRRADNIISLNSLTPACLADAIEQALSRVVFDATKAIGGLKAMQSLLPLADFPRVAEWLIDIN